MPSEDNNYREVAIEDIASFCIDFERDIRKRRLGAKMVVFVRKPGEEHWRFYTPVKMLLRETPNGLALTHEIPAIPITNEHAKFIGEELVRANIVLESREEKDKRIDDLKMTIVMLEERIKFFENMMYSTCNLSKEDIERIRMIRSD